MPTMTTTTYTHIHEVMTTQYTQDGGGYDNNIHKVAATTMTTTTMYTKVTVVVSNDDNPVCMRWRW